MQEKNKDTSLGEYKYRLSKMSPLIASRIHGWLVYVALNFAQQQQDKPEIKSDAPVIALDVKEQADGTVKMLWLMAPSALSEEACTKIQMYALRACEQYDPNNVTVPVLMADGRFAARGLEEDAVAVSELITRSLQFSLSPFFIEGLQAARAATPNKIPS